MSYNDEIDSIYYATKRALFEMSEDIILAAKDGKQIPLKPSLIVCCDNGPGGKGTQLGIRYQRKPLLVLESIPSIAAILSGQPSATMTKSWEEKLHRLYEQEYNLIKQTAEKCYARENINKTASYQSKIVAAAGRLQALETEISSIENIRAARKFRTAIWALASGQYQKEQTALNKALAERSQIHENLQSEKQYCERFDQDIARPAYRKRIDDLENRYTESAIAQRLEADLALLTRRFSHCMKKSHNFTALPCNQTNTDESLPEENLIQYEISLERTWDSAGRPRKKQEDPPEITLEQRVKDIEESMRRSRQLFLDLLMNQEFQRVPYQKSRYNGYSR